MQQLVTRLEAMLVHKLLWRIQVTVPQAYSTTAQ
jgi:hypothetical protein